MRPKKPQTRCPQRFLLVGDWSWDLRCPCGWLRVWAHLWVLEKAWMLERLILCIYLSRIPTKSSHLTQKSESYLSLLILWKTVKEHSGGDGNRLIPNSLNFYLLTFAVIWRFANRPSSANAKTCRGDFINCHALWFSPCVIFMNTG